MSGGSLDIWMLVCDSALTAFALYLTYTIFRGSQMLVSNFGKYKFGSPCWWNYIEHLFIIFVAFVGAAGLTITQLLHTIEQSESHLYCDPLESWGNLFTIIIMGSLILTVKHVIYEEKEVIDKTGEYDLPERRQVIDRRRIENPPRNCV